MSKYYRNCGTQLGENVRFCPSCGTVVSIPHDTSISGGAAYTSGGGIGFSDRINSPETVKYIK